jgi:YihY family inner membrane protein
VVQTEIGVLAPGQAQWLTGEIASSLENRAILGGLGLVVLLFFSSLAFRMLEDAISLIFGRPQVDTTERSFWVSAVIPYMFIAMLGVGVFMLTTIQTLLERVSGAGIGVYGTNYSLETVPTLFVDTFSIIGLAVLLALVYKVLPATKISFRRAMAGGVTAALLWDATRRVLVYWFSSISLVNVVYGSLATVIIVLLSAEIGAVIVLLGAQVIAELEHAEADERPWYESGEE